MRETLSKNPAHVFDVFRATSEDLGDDQVFRADDRQDRASNVHWNCALQKLLLEARSRQNDIDGNIGVAVNKRKDAGTLHEIGNVADSEIEPRLPHRANERSGILMEKLGRDVHVPSQTRSAPDLNRLSSEQVPSVRPGREDRGE